ncbi:MAG: hypothetical protein GEV08_22305 [Acidimicrobiia bacterium]|nr:hypothetical protein [Acidimicrobiia bacterium]
MGGHRGGRRALWGGAACAGLVAALVAVALLAGVGGEGGTGGDAAPTSTARPGAVTTAHRPPTTAVAGTPASPAPVPLPVPAPPAGLPGPLDCAVAPAPRPLDSARPRYVADLAVDVVGGTATGEVHVAFIPDLAVDHLVFRLWANGPRSLGAGGGLEVTGVGASARVASTEQPDPTTLVVRLGAPVQAGETVEATVAWRLLLPFRADDRVAFGEGWARLGSVVPLLAWEAGVGWALAPGTAGFAEASLAPAADWDLGVRVAEGYEVLATGALVGDRWLAVGARDVAVSIGRFRRATAVVAAPGPVEVTVAVAEGLPDHPATYLATVSDALTSFAARFGPYPWPAYTLAVTPDLGGGIEYPGHVMQGPSAGDGTTSHEVAHQWFYGLVGNDQGRDPVLDEGLATYAELTHLGVALDPAAWPMPDTALGAAGQPMAYWDQHADSYYEGVYVQGALALAALGPPDLVDCGLRAYAAENAWAIATPAGLVATMARVAPAAPAVLASYGIG